MAEEPGDTPETVAAFTVRPHRPGDEAAVAELYRAAFDGSWYPSLEHANHEDHIRWFVERHGPVQGHIDTLETDGQIVAIRGWRERPLQLRDRVVAATIGGLGAATAPAFQGRNLHRTYIRGWSHARRGPMVSVGIHNRPLDAPAASRERLLQPGNQLSFLLRVEHPWQAAGDRDEGNRLLSYAAFTGVELWGRLRSRAAPRTSTVRTVDAFDERFDRFWSTVGPRWEMIPTRSAEYLNWRYCDPRAGRFDVRVAEQDGAFLGYIVSAVVAGRGHIVDLLALPDRDDVVRDLVQSALDFLRSAGSNAIECWLMRHHPYTVPLRQAGFVRIPHRSRDLAGKLRLTSKPMTEEERARIERPGAAIHLVEGDLDVI